MNGKIIRATSLIALIITGLAFCIINWIAFFQASYMIIPAVAFTVIYIWVLIMEIIGATTGYKKTLSTRWKHWAEKNPILSWTALGLFWVAMTALVVHLGWYYG